jgi:hypothetical protein
VWERKTRKKGKIKPQRYIETLITELFVTFLNVIVFISLRSFQQYQWYHHQSFSVPPRSFYFLYFFISPLSSQITKRREKNKQKKPWRLTETPIITPLVSLKRSWCWLCGKIWTACVAHFGHHSWPFLMSLDSSCRYLFIGAGCVVIRVLVCLKGLVFSFFLFLFLSLSLFF